MVLICRNRLKKPQEQYMVIFSAVLRIHWLVIRDNPVPEIATLLLITFKKIFLYEFTYCFYTCKTF